MSPSKFRTSGTERPRRGSVEGPEQGSDQGLIISDFMYVRSWSESLDTGVAVVWKQKDMRSAKEDKL